MRKCADPEKKAAVIKRVIEDGEKQTDVAKDLGISLQTVNYWVKNHISGIVYSSGKSDRPPFARITFGKVLTRLRYRSATSERIPSTDSFARRIGIGGSSLRMLESGHHLPPMRIAHKLAVELNLSLPKLIMLIGLTRFIDESENEAESLEAGRVFGETDPILGFFVQAMSDASSKTQKERSQLLKSDELTSKLLDFIQSKSVLDDCLEHNCDQRIHQSPSKKDQRTAGIFQEHPIYNPVLINGAVGESSLATNPSSIKWQLREYLSFFWGEDRMYKSTFPIYLIRFQAQANDRSTIQFVFKQAYIDSGLEIDDTHLPNILLQAEMVNGISHIIVCLTQADRESLRLAKP